MTNQSSEKSVQLCYIYNIPLYSCLFKSPKLTNLIGVIFMNYQLLLLMRLRPSMRPAGFIRMALLRLLALLAVVAAGHASEIVKLNLDESGIGIIESPGYPDPIKNGTRITWQITSPPGTTVELSCYDIRLIQDNPPDCDQDRLIIEGGNEKRELCGTHYGYPVAGVSNTMRVELIVGHENSGGVSCTARAVKSDSSMPKYLNIPSEEVDSSEHGGPPGQKKTSCACGWANKEQTKIVNGVEAKVNEYPFIVALIDKEMGFQFCGGSLITEYHVLTAAHCTAHYVTTGRRMFVLAAEHDLSSVKETNATRAILVERILQHREFDPKMLKHDISVLLLAQRVQFNKWIGPVCLSPVQLEIPGQYVKIIGWGALKYQGPAPPTLQKVNVRVVDRLACHNAFGGAIDYIKPTQICAYASNKGACNGDSGGPVVWLDPQTNRFVLAGLVSFGIICADDNPSVHTDVSAYYTWIHERIRESIPRPTCSKVG